LSRLAEVPTVDTRATQIERRIEIPVILAALLSLPALFLEDSKSDTAHEVGYIAGFGLWLVFLAEIVVMLAVVPSRSRWLRDHPLDLAIVLLTPPFFLPRSGDSGSCGCSGC